MRVASSEFSPCHDCMYKHNASVRVNLSTRDTTIRHAPTQLVISCNLNNYIFISFNERLLSINNCILYDFIFYFLYCCVLDYVHCSIVNLCNAMQADGLRVPKHVACRIYILMCISMDVRRIVT
jgi:hypothetical protein